MNVIQMMWVALMSVSSLNAYAGYECTSNDGTTTLQVKAPADEQVVLTSDQSITVFSAKALPVAGGKLFVERKFCASDDQWNRLDSFQLDLDWRRQLEFDWQLGCEWYSQLCYLHRAFWISN